MDSCYHPTGRETSDGLKLPAEWIRRNKLNNWEYCEKEKIDIKKVVIVFVK